MMDGFFSQEDYDALFDTVVLSGSLGIAKFNPEVFKQTCQILNVALDEAVMIDDMQNTIDVVKKMGMSGICYKSFTQFRTELDILS